MDMRTAQLAYDASAEPEQAEDLTPAEALEQAHYQLAATPEVITNWLAAECAGDDKPLNPWDMTGRAHALTLPEALVAMFNLSDQDALPMLRKLRAEFERYHASDAAGIADELMAAQAVAV